MEMTMTFPGGKKVDAVFKGYTVNTDQPEKAGGEGSSPAPFELFLASLGTCSAYFVLSFCQSRDLPTEGVGVTLSTDYDKETHKLAGVDFKITVPPGFPEKYHTALVRAVHQCSVKKALEDPPKMTTKVEVVA
ncbi:MAG: OsmC family protein [Deltaproteobacteria bacterium]|nr:OsmC family protein [Deltaproteobacteria bacterium]MCB9479973.1 OsmC family protein [Deltaproteobacteria bacterium]MCB9489240.1 OsmC family protein [Deltaproteobacteria bacterium]